MSKKAIFFIIISLLAANLFGSQRLFDADSPEYIFTDYICSIAGVSGPSPVFPISGEEIAEKLKEIAASDIPDEINKIRKSILADIDESDETFTFDPRASISPQFFLTENYFLTEEEGGGRSSFFLPYNKEVSSLSFGFGAEFGNTVFLETDIDFRNKPLAEGIPLTSFDWIVSYISPEHRFHKNDNSINEVPLLARGSIGNRWFSLIVGRTPQSIGTGFTGNLTISDNFDYQEVLIVKIHSNIFSYTNSITHFDEETDQFVFKTPSFGGMHQVRVLNRLDFNILDKVRIAANIMSLYYSSSAFDIRWLTPMMFSHNYYNFSGNTEIESGSTDEANNAMSFELSWSFLPSWNIGFQFIIDQVQAKIFGEDPDALPNAYGALFNLSWKKNIGNNLLTAWGEIAYTNPYLYLNQKTIDGNANYNYDYILGYHRSNGVASTAAYTGYAFGPDTIVCAIGTDVIDLKANVKYGGKLLYKVHGEKGFDSTDINPHNEKITPTGEYPEHMLQLTGNAEWSILDDSMDVFGGLSLCAFFNYQNAPGNKFVPQAYFGVTWRPLDTFLR